MLNLFEVMKFKREIRTSCCIDVMMLDTAEDGFVLYVPRKTLNADSYKLLADFAEQKQLNLQLDSGNFLISTNALAAQWCADR